MRSPKKTGRHFPSAMGASRSGAASAEATAAVRSDLLLRGLLSIARQSGITEPTRCGITIDLLAAGRVVHARMLRVMQPLGLSEARFNTLLALYVLDPMPLSPANLAYHAAITRTAMTDTLDQMAKQGWISRERLKSDRRVIHIRLTGRGRETANAAIERFLNGAAEISENLRPAQQKAFSSVCRGLRLRAEALVPGL